ncbi:MAG TPA: hypothetical protein PLN06_06355 [Bacteroidales bacterium]|nr:hypothetical protein [Bacteroidales bacterium]HQG36952.1 hypothetical protein [Bacteroidales bacterium]HQG52033.1 hypothetical protein [Bacteroidales bacterium]HQJ21212.1 hypothetical protein [Bacteroidales bacterium]HRC89553.1 hypothetical protein [Bacteroidales bacterium]
MLNCKGIKYDTIDLKMPQWTPGYYQIMDYYKEVKNLSAGSKRESELIFYGSVKE